MITEATLLAKGISLAEKHADSIFSHIVKKVKHKDKIQKIDCRMAFEEYMNNSIVRYSKMKTFLNNVSPEDFYNVFVKTDLTIRDKTFNVGDIKSILDISNFLVIEGTAGIGKSTIMNHFFLDTVNSNRLVPVLIHLRELNENSLSLYDNLYTSLNSLGFNLEKEYFDYALETGNFLILLDGFDEVLPEKQSKIINELNKLSARYNKNFFILSSRQCNITNTALTNFTVLETVPLSREQAIKLVENINFESITKAKFIEDLRTKLYQIHKTFASIPLLLMIMLMTYDSYANIPNKVHNFFGQAIETLFYRHDSIKGKYERVMTCKLDKEEFKNVFARFCFNSYFKSEIIFPAEQLKYYFDLIKNDLGLNYDSNLIINDLVQAVCLLKVDGLKYTFTHRSFQEYFTALYIKSLTDQQQKHIFKNINYEHYLTSLMIDMLYDMDRYRFEENCIIPNLTEYMLDDETDYDLFKRVVTDSYSEYGVNLDKNMKAHGDVYIRILDDEYCYNDFVAILLKILRQSKNIEINQDDIDKFAEYLINNKKYSSDKEGNISRVSADTIDIFKDLELEMLFRKTRFGKCAEELTKLKGRIELEHEIRSKSILDIF